MGDLPSVETLHKLLICDAGVGKLYWRERGVEWFSPGNTSREARAAGWNNRYAGSEALINVNQSGYRRGAVLDVIVFAHRVVWAMHTGAWPSSFLDHTNGVRLDNRIANLREASEAQNKANVGKRYDRRPTSRFIGVELVRATGRWGASVRSGPARHWCGTFATEEEAARARDAVALKLRGEFARLNFPEAP